MCLLSSIKNKKMNNNNQPSTITTAVVTAVIVGLFGYFLFRTAPDNKAYLGGKTASVDNSMANHHGRAQMAVNSEELNSLIGNPMPNIQLTDKDGKAFTVTSLAGKNTVLFFNEGLMCYPACWNQMAAFGKDSRFNSKDIQAVSVVVDSAHDWQQAIDKMPELARTMTMFDIGANASRQLGVLVTESSMHRGSLPGHTYIVIDKKGIVRYVFDDPNMAIANDMLAAKIAELNN